MQTNLTDVRTIQQRRDMSYTTLALASGSEQASAGSRKMWALTPPENLAVPLSATVAVLPLDQRTAAATGPKRPQRCCWPEFKHLRL